MKGLPNASTHDRQHVHVLSVCESCSRTTSPCLCSTRRVPDILFYAKNISLWADILASHEKLGFFLFRSGWADSTLVNVLEIKPTVPCTLAESSYMPTAKHMFETE